jgi:low affinity Fe/Cu permease
MIFTRIASAISHAAGQPAAFAVAVAAILAWAGLGPFVGFSETWQLVVNTGTTIITFLMVFVLQNTQNRDTTALHTKLDALIRAGEADDRFIGIEHLSVEDLERLRERCEAAARVHAGRAGTPPENRSRGEE